MEDVQDVAKRTLTVEQAAEYERNGYVSVADVFSRDELQVVDDEMDRVVAEAEAKGQMGIGHTGPNRNEGWLLQLGSPIRADETIRAG
jgi:ectoine hydroxylase-related dioxygenase (phytanoyl-CoA dioxygenase family)